MNHCQAMTTQANGILFCGISIPASCRNANTVQDACNRVAYAIKWTGDQESGPVLRALEDLRGWIRHELEAQAHHALQPAQRLIRKRDNEAALIGIEFHAGATERKAEFQAALTTLAGAMLSAISTAKALELHAEAELIQSNYDGLCEQIASLR